MNQQGPVVYWMSRDQRAEDNWALIYAQRLAIEYRQPLLVVFCLVPRFLEAALRQYAFMLRGLYETFSVLTEKNIQCTLLRGFPDEVLPEWLKTQQAGLVVTDFDPLKDEQAWKTKLIHRLELSCLEVDAHNIVPCWLASTKQEYAAYTLRPKIHRLLPEFLDEFPPVIPHPFVKESVRFDLPAFEKFLSTPEINREVAEVTWLTPGSAAAKQRLDNFVRTALADYGEKGNDPTRDMQSNLSPYLHFGQLAPQRAALTVMQQEPLSASSSSYLEELIIRRELADNFCYYRADYDQCGSFAAWANKTLAEHLDDAREHDYSLSELEHAKTHDALWNAAQRQMVRLGKMHGYMRMYWAKKILEWTPSPRHAMKMAIYLNDKYELDGRDPNGYAGIAWSIGGVHDRAWSERKIFGKIRYMSFNGMRRKFSVNSYIDSYS